MTDPGSERSQADPGHRSAFVGHDTAVVLLESAVSWFWSFPKQQRQLGDPSRVGSVVLQVAEVAAASGLTGFLLRVAAFLITAEPRFWGLGAAPRSSGWSLLPSPASASVSTDCPYRCSVSSA